MELDDEGITDFTNLLLCRLFLVVLRPLWNAY